MHRRQKIRKKNTNNVEGKKKKKGKHIVFICPNGMALDYPMAFL